MYRCCRDDGHNEGVVSDPRSSKPRVVPAHAYVRVEVVHACPTDGEVVTPCCGYSPFELHPLDRLTLDADLVTCRP